MSANLVAGLVYPQVARMAFLSIALLDEMSVVEMVERLVGVEAECLVSLWERKLGDDLENDLAGM